MSNTTSRSRVTRWAWALPAGLGVLQVVVAIWLAMGAPTALAPWIIAGLGGAALLIAGWIVAASCRATAQLRLTSATDLHAMADALDATVAAIGDQPAPADADAADALAAAVGRLLHKVAGARTAAAPIDPATLQDSRLIPIPRPIATVPALTRSGLFDSAQRFDPTLDPMASQEFASTETDMIARLDPRLFRWIDSSPAEQAFLGWPLARLRTMSFLEIVHPDHRELAREQLRAAILKGEAHGLVYRVRTARGEAKAVEINVGVRYAPDASVDHLRCHVTDVTERLRASRELRRRTKDLLSANELLIRANKELLELKDRYSDLYQNAPAMYFSLDETGTFLDCNDTLLTTLGYRRGDLIGRPYVTIVPEWRRPAFATNFARYLSQGHVEVESRWLKSDGTMIDVWIKGVAVIAPGGELLHSRSIAQDVTARKALEAELQEKHARLARANDDLARRNTELDEFSHVVSHDLQEPVRTLIGFSKILMSEHGDTLGEQGREQLRYLMEASQRMRTLIRDLLSLSRAGRAAGEFGPVDLEGILSQLRSDFSATINSRGAELVVSSPLPTAWGDRDRVAQLLGNLIGNGLKYQHPDIRPVVEVSATANPSGGVTIAVKDNGIGIDPKYHDKIFQIFRRLHTRDEFEGTGAGLAICQKIVLAHGGRIWVESQVGQGATFFVFLPGA